MDKFSLNQQIVLSRPVVRLAKERVNKKLIRHVKVLKSCKNPDKSVKKKKERKISRLLKEVKVIRHLKDDEVIKFALRTKDPNTVLQKTDSSEKKHALAKLALRQEIQKKVEELRKQIPHWEAVLPRMLDALGTRSAKKKKKNKMKPTVQDNKETKKNQTKTKLQITEEKGWLVEDIEGESVLDYEKNEKEWSDQDDEGFEVKENQIEKERQKQVHKVVDKVYEAESEDDMANSVESVDNSVKSRKMQKNSLSNSEDDMEDENEDNDSQQEVEATFDSFFINKKVKFSKSAINDEQTVIYHKNNFRSEFNKPFRNEDEQKNNFRSEFKKPFRNEDKHHKNNFRSEFKKPFRNEDKQHKNNFRSEFNKPFRNEQKYQNNDRNLEFNKYENDRILNRSEKFRRKDDHNEVRNKFTTKEETEEKLHPSWAAKRKPMNVPFQGKKMKFDD